MSITHELRKWASVEVPYKYGHQLSDIADRIDAEHEEAIASVMNDALYRANEKDMAELGWIRLPKDADGVPIHVGDVMEMDDELFEVRRIELDESGEWTMRDRMGVGHLYAHLYRHYHASTVEDLIRDAILSCIGHSPEYWDEPIAECATKLQLKEDE